MDKRKSLKKAAFTAAAAVALLSGCAVVPAEPVVAYPGPVYAAPVAPPVVVVGGGYGYYGHRWRHWR
ncbi:MAG: hypothetical protein ACM30H_13355 [Clostridia bacterium]